MKYLSVLLILLFVVSCSTPTSESEYSGEEETAQSQVSTSENGVVVTAHPLATKAGLDMLAKGGNAFDAAVAAAFTLSVVEPSMSGLGGRLQAIAMKSDGTISGVDASTEAPVSYDPEGTPEKRYGYHTVGIPGVVKGLTTLLEKHGTLPLETVMAPAIHYAENGFNILYGEARRHGSAIDMIREFPATTAYFVNGDTTFQEGDLVVQKDLANTLRAIAEEGGDAFYKGEIAERIAADMAANGGFVDVESLAAYEARESQLVTGSYRGYDLHGLWLPSFGAITIEILHILENFPMSEYSSAEWASTVYQANTLAYRDRRKQYEEGSMDMLISKEYALERADSIVTTEVVPEAAMRTLPASWMSDGHTTHLSVADKDGNVIALTQSIGPNMGSKVTTEGLGFVYATTMGGYLGDFEPGQRASSHISPFLVTKDGKPFLVLGAAGGSRIITAIVQTICQVVDGEMSLDDAVAAGRVHSADTALILETHEGTTWTGDDVSKLNEWGIEVVEIDQTGRFGRIHGIMFDSESGTWTGVADPDWEGTAASPQDKD